MSGGDDRACYEAADGWAELRSKGTTSYIPAPSYFRNLFFLRQDFAKEFMLRHAKRLEIRSMKIYDYELLACIYQTFTLL